MDFALTDDQQELRELAGRIFGDLADHASQRRVEVAAAGEGEGNGNGAGSPGIGGLDEARGEARFDRRLWAALAEAGLLGLAVPEEYGGAGLGFLEVCVVLEEAGKAAAPIPLTAATVLGILPVARFGSDELRGAWLNRAVSGSTLITGALGASGGDPVQVPVTATATTGGGWRLDGVAAYVPAGMAADAAIVPGVASDGPGLFLVGLGRSGVTRQRQDATDGRVEAILEMQGVDIEPPAVLAEPGPAGDEALRWCRERAMAATCVEVAGACRGAVDLTAKYTAERIQFGKPIATFQAVGQRAADAYIDTEAVRLTAWQAAWRLDRELPASAEVAVAKFWADDGAQRVVHAAQHLHGGVGVDRDYPLHRYYLLVKHLAPSLGGTTASLLRLGDILADAPAS